MAVPEGHSIAKRGRSSLDEVVERDPNTEIHAKVAGNHGAILKKDCRADADAVSEEVSGLAR